MKIQSFSWKSKISFFCLVASFFQISMAWAGLAVICHPSKKGTFSQDDVKSMYSGRKQSGTLVDQSSSAVRGDFYQKLLGKTDAQMKAIWNEIIFAGGAAPRVEKDDNAVVQYVSEHEDAVGYVNSDKADASKVAVLFNL